jgi:hypothetical protein
MSVRNGLPPIHPGELLKEALDELGTSQAEFAAEDAVDAGERRESNIDFFLSAPPRPPRPRR